MEFFYLIPIALVLGAIGLGAFLWSLRSGQHDDLDGAAERILFDNEDVPRHLAPPAPAPLHSTTAHRDPDSV